MTDPVPDAAPNATPAATPDDAGPRPAGRPRPKRGHPIPVGLPHPADKTPPPPPGLGPLTEGADEHRPAAVRATPARDESNADVGGGLLLGLTRHVHPGWTPG